jgi:hypothetical protein
MKWKEGRLGCREYVEKERVKERVLGLCVDDDLD